MDLVNLRITWDEFARRDVLWSIMSCPDKKDNRWEIDNFFKTGQNDIDFILQEAEKRYPQFQRNKALDFGCGVGRMTIPLSKRFKETVGVDISAQMIGKAKVFAKNVSGCSFVVNEEEDLCIFPEAYFDFILSLIVLQHMERRYILNYIKEFLRLLKPVGLLVFQLPSQIELKAGYQEFKPGMSPEAEMYGISKEKMFDYIKLNKGEIVDCVKDNACGKEINSLRYFVKKQRSRSI
ncbi:class I SAM-dependent methyltransferase [bacterium]|nr:class I SAM-dependent methyltransferase [bacterium]